jgi:hypothetical protein
MEGKRKNQKIKLKTAKEIDWPERRGEKIVKMSNGEAIKEIIWKDDVVQRALLFIVNHSTSVDADADDYVIVDINDDYVIVDINKALEIKLIFKCKHDFTNKYSFIFREDEIYRRAKVKSCNKCGQEKVEVQR